VTLLIAKAIDLTIGLRVSSDEETRGLDLATHDELRPTSKVPTDRTGGTQIEWPMPRCT